MAMRYSATVDEALRSASEHLDIYILLRPWLATDRDRSAWLAEIAALGPVLLTAGGPQTTQHIADSIADLGRYWP